MELTDCKIKNEDYENMDIASLSDRPSADGMSAQTLKERFDASTKHIVQPKINQLIDILTSTEGAGNIGITPIEGVAGYNVQQILTAIKLLLDDKKNAEQSDREIAQKFDAAEAQALVKEVTFSEGSGVFTITKYDGSVQTYDTALEKVALDVRLDGQQFVLTLADGSEQRVDLSAFLTQTEVKNSDTITLSIENGAIVARLATGSIQKMHLSDALIEYIEGKEGLAADSAAAAKVSEQNALNSANAAKASEQAAKTCQEQACLCATQAGLSSNAAAASESNAKASEQAAKEAADRAVDAAGGDFVTNTAFNQFKETVPTLDDGKVSVQQGGLYINPETTEEDKAEAQEALAELGYGFKSYRGFSEIGLETGSETIENIANTLPVWSELITPIGSSDNTTIYPDTYGSLRVIKFDNTTRVIFEFIKKAVNQKWLGVYDSSISAPWSGWVETANPAGYLSLDDSVSMIGARPNANLLYNWYFGNPVNRKGLQLYSFASGYYNVTIDGWSVESNISMQLNDSNITIENKTDAWSILYHQIRADVAKQFIGHKMTYSVLLDGSEGNAARAYIYNGSQVVAIIDPLKVGLNTVTFEYPFASTDNITVRVQTRGVSKLDIKAIKLELGDKQTLAHQDADGNWVLNEIPDYAEQMAICEQYSLKNCSYEGNNFKTTWYPITTLTNGLVYNDTSCGYWVYGKQVTVAMRIASGLSLDAGTEVPLFTLPVGFRPSRHIEVPCACRYSNYNAPIKAGIKSDGTVLLYNSHTSAISTPSNITFEATFFIE